MKRVLVTVLLLIASASAQNWAAVTATKLAYVDKSPIATGKFCVTATNDSDTAISFRTGDGEQIARYTKCVTVTNGVAAALSVPNPATTAPANIRYRVEVKDNSGVVLTYKGVYFTGTTFSFDEYVPNTTALKTGQTVDVLTVKDLTITTSCVGCGEGGAGAAGVASFNGRTGAVTPQTNDYSWSQIASKPATFTPSTHNHTKSEVTDFPTTWAWGSLTGVPSTFTPSAHNQAFTTITGVLDLAQMPNCTVDGQIAKRVSGAWQCAPDATGAGGTSGVSSFNGSTGDVTYAPSWTDVTAKPSTFTPEAHTHLKASITDFPTLATVATSGSYNDLLNKPTIPAAQVQSDWNAVSGMGQILNKPTLGTAAASSTTDFAAASHTQAISTITGLQTALDGKQAAGSYAAANASTTVNGQACALGGSCTVADSTKVATTRTVNGHALSADVTVTKSDVGLGNVDNTADSAKPISTAAQTALDGKAASAHTHVKANITDFPTLATVATSGSYNDLADKPAIPTVNNKRPCEITITGSGSSGVLQDTDDEAAKCHNQYGATLTIESVECRADAGSPTVMVTISGGANALTGNLTCGTATYAAGTLSGTPTVADAGALDFTIVSAGGTAHEVTIVVGRTL